MVIGNQGNGKSSLLNSLTKNGNFQSGFGVNPETLQLAPKLLKWRYSSSWWHSKACFIDTEGFGDMDGNDSDKSKELAKFLKRIKHINLILFVIKSSDYR